MNFLAHLYLAPDDDEALLGSLMGDFVKGPLRGHHSPGIERGLALHRRIDVFTDAHSVVRRSRGRIGPDRRRYAGIMVDMFYDHYLARDWARYAAQPLEQFARRVYALLEAHRGRLPATLQYIAPVMSRQDWLSSYRETQAVSRALERMGERLKRGNALLGAGADLADNYAGLGEDFHEFFPQLIAFAHATHSA
jgi:acyl carrier protein phosphodiesterase